MEFRHLRSFCVVAEELHVTRAAKRLHIAQPALSQQISTLESDWGVALFRRVGRRLELTQAGEFLKREAPAILEKINDVRTRTVALERVTQHSLKLAIPEVTAMADLMMRIVRAYRQKMPEVTLTEQIQTPSDVGQSLREHEVDAALFCPIVPDAVGVERRLLGRIPALLAVPKDHALCGLKSVRIEDIRDERLVLITHGNYPRSFEAKFRSCCAEHGFSPIVIQSTTSALFALNYVISHNVVTIVPASLRGMRRDVLRYLPFKGAPDLCVELILYLRSEEKLAQVLAFKKISAQICREQTRGAFLQLCK